MSTRAVVAVMAIGLTSGCGGPDTLHYQLRDPHLVTVCVDGQPVLDDSGESPRYDNMTRTGDDTIAQTTFTVEHSRYGLFAKWETALPMLYGERLELVGNDGWVAALPLDIPRRTTEGQAQLFVTPALQLISTKHTHGYVSELMTPHAGDHVITLSTPRENVVAVEQRGDQTRSILSAVPLVYGAIASAIGTGILVTNHKHMGGRVVGGMFATAGVTFDAIGIYQLVRGLRRRPLPLP